MSSSKSGSRKDDGKNKGRNLPSSMSSKKDRNISSGQKKTVQFSKLMEGVVVVLSGFVNPERSTLRSQALEMGAEYKADWSSDCTLLVCAFPNTPKFRQVEADSGTIVSKEWISECYKQKKLVEIDPYLMNVGKPWRKANHLHDAPEGQDVLPARPQTKVKGTAHSGTARSPKAKETASSSNAFSSSKVKEWAIKDLTQTISWLESQDEKPEPDEIKKIAAQGITTCLQDAIEALKQNQGIKDGMSQWMFVPQVVKKLAEIEESTAKDELIKVATDCEQIYAAELEALDERLMNKRLKPNEELADDGGSDSDATIVMTGEEIDLACRSAENS